MSKITPPPAMTDEKIDEICDAALYADGPYGSLVSRSTEVARDKQWLDLLAQKQDRERNFEEFGEGWESLAWELCAQEHGEEACSELIWEGGPIPEPWGDRWLKYEDEAKRLIALVHKHAAPVAQQADRQRVPEGWGADPSAAAVELAKMVMSDCGLAVEHRHDLLGRIAARIEKFAAAPEAPAQASESDERDRKDAERYRFIRNADRSDPHLPYQALMAYACESFDEAIDDAMEEEVRAALAQKGGAA